MGRKKKEEVEDIATSESLELTPEYIVRYISEHGNLPDDFNPYGDYIPEKLRFLGDKPPIDTPYYVGVNEDDSDLRPIYVSTPTPPELSLIDGYNLKRDDQIWTRLEMPPRLKKLEDRSFKEMLVIQERNRQETVQGYKVYQAFWKMLEEEQADYQEEIQWIKKIWWYRTWTCYLKTIGTTDARSDWF